MVLDSNFKKDKQSLQNGGLLLRGVPRRGEPPENPGETKKTNKLIVKGRLVDLKTQKIENVIIKWNV